MLGAAASPAAASSFAISRLQRGTVLQAGHVREHPQRDEQRAGLVDGQPQRAGDGLGLADHDLPALVGQIDRAVRIGVAQLHAPEQVEVIDQLALAQPERRRGLGQAGRLPADHVGHQRQQPLQAFRGGRAATTRRAAATRRATATRRAATTRRATATRPLAHVRTPLSRRITASRRSGGSATTTSAPNEATWSANHPVSENGTLIVSQPSGAGTGGLVAYRRSP